MDISQKVKSYTDDYLHGFQDIYEHKDKQQIAIGSIKAATYILSVGILPLLAYLANYFVSWKDKKTVKLNTEPTENTAERVKKAEEILKGSESVNLEPKSTEDSFLEDGEEPRSSTLVLSPEQFKQKLFDNSLPKTQKIHVKGDLNLSGCSNLKSLPKGLSVGGYLILWGCTSLTSLPEGLSVGGDLNLRGCTSFTTFPENFTVGGNLDLQGCTSFTSLPEGLSVGGDLDLGYCTSFTSLPEGLSVGGDVYLHGCTSLTSLPEGLSVGGNLNLEDCTRFTTFPENFTVGGDLYLGHCTRFTTFPENFTVGGDLYLSYCTSFTTFLENFNIGGNLNLGGCTSLTSLPNWIIELGYRSDGEVRAVDLTGTGLSDELIARLQESDHPGIQFHISQRAHKPAHVFENIKKALEFWGNLAKEEDIPDLQFQNNSNEVLDFLGRLTSTAEYNNLKTRTFLSERIMNVFKVMSSDSTIKDNAVQLIQAGLTSCDDRIISSLSEIELMIQIHEIESGELQEEGLRELGKSFLALEMVNQKVKDYIPTLRWVDEIEVYLAFQIGLAERFKLPIKTRNMIFRGCANVSDKQIEQFGNQIEDSLTEERLDEFLKTWSPWQKCQESKAKEIAVKSISYEDLPVDEEVDVRDKEKYPPKSIKCLISLDEPEKPVIYNRQIYDYEWFNSHYQENGYDPINTDEKIDLSKLKKVKKEHWDEYKSNI